jgi:hypothetical protein
MGLLRPFEESFGKVVRHVYLREPDEGSSLPVAPSPPREERAELTLNGNLRDAGTAPYRGRHENTGRALRSPYTSSASCR